MISTCPPSPRHALPPLQQSSPEQQIIVDNLEEERTGCEAADSGRDDHCMEQHNDRLPHLWTDTERQLSAPTSFIDSCSSDGSSHHHATPLLVEGGTHDVNTMEAAQVSNISDSLLTFHQQSTLDDDIWESMMELGRISNSIRMKATQDQDDQKQNPPLYIAASSAIAPEHAALLNHPRPSSCRIRQSASRSNKLQATKRSTRTLHQESNETTTQSALHTSLAEEDLLAMALNGADPRIHSRSDVHDSIDNEIDNRLQQASEHTGLNSHGHYSHGHFPVCDRFQEQGGLPTVNSDPGAEIGGIIVRRRTFSEPGGNRLKDFWFQKTCSIRRRLRNNRSTSGGHAPAATPSHSSSRSTSPPHLLQQLRHPSGDILEGTLSVSPTRVDELTLVSADGVLLDGRSGSVGLPSQDDDPGAGAAENGDLSDAPNHGATEVGGTGQATSEHPPPTDPNRDARVRWIRINRRFQLMISVVAVMFSFLLFAILICWIVLTSAYVVTMNRSCDVPLKSFYWLVTLQLVLQIFRADILRFIFCWDPSARDASQEGIPVRVMMYNIAYLIFALLVLRMGFNSVFIQGYSNDSTCWSTAPELFQASLVFVALTVAAWTTIVFGYMVPFCFVASLLTWNGYNPGDAHGGGALGAGVFPAAYSRTGAQPGCVELLREVNLDELNRDEVPLECCICMEDFVAGSSTGRLNPDDVIVATECGHLFHKACCREWLRQARTCPVCRTDIPDSQMQRQNEGEPLQGGSDLGPDEQFPDPNHSSVHGQPTSSLRQMESQDGSTHRRGLDQHDNMGGLLRIFRNRRRRTEVTRYAAQTTNDGVPSANVEMTLARDSHTSNN